MNGIFFVIILIAFGVAGVRQVMWEPPGMVKVGYSNFNQDCELNWSNYGSGWVLNSENPVFFGCSWPMMRVEVEVVTPGDCD